MSLFTVDPGKCKRDGICAAECPVRIIQLPEGGGVPELVTYEADPEQYCINCGHCVAVCPHGAMSHQSMASDECPPVNRDWLLDAERVEHFLRYRRSIRVYKDEPVDRDTLVKLIEIARYGPTGHNTQSVEWLVIYDRAELTKLAGHTIDWMRWVIKEMPALAEMLHMSRTVGGWEAGYDVILRGAPHVIVAHAHKDDRTAPASCTIAMTYLDLAAPSLGLGSCWAGYFNASATMWQPMQEALGLEAGHLPFCSMMIGRPKFKYHRLPERNEPPITWK